MYILTEQLNEVNLQDEIFINCLRLPIFYVRLRFAFPLQKWLERGVGVRVGGWRVGGRGEVNASQHKAMVPKTNMISDNIYRKG